MPEILIINPGSTSTKLALFEGEECRYETSLAHSPEELKAFTRIIDQADMRLACIKRFLADNRIKTNELAAVVGRGGLLKPIECGTYLVNQAMLDDLETGRYGEHASNLGAVMAHHIAADAGCKAYIVDPVVADEMDDISRLSGLPQLPRKSIFHALNQKSTAREIAARLGRSYADCNFIVAHLGGGVSVGAHRRGRVVDVNNALNGDGPFSPERTGGLPAGQLVELCFSGEFSKDEIKRMNVGRGGLVAYKGTNRLDEIHAMIEAGDRDAELVFAAMALQISKEIAMHGATLKGEVDRIILTGGMANDRILVDMIRERVGFVAPVEVIPGEREMLSLARGYLAVASGREPEKEYT